jgi:hypothetical protein
VSKVGTPAPLATRRYAREIDDNQCSESGVKSLVGGQITPLSMQWSRSEPAIADACEVVVHASTAYPPRISVVVSGRSNTLWTGNGFVHSRALGDTQ